MSKTRALCIRWLLLPSTSNWLSKQILSLEFWSWTNSQKRSIATLTVLKKNGFCRVSLMVNAACLGLPVASFGTSRLWWKMLSRLTAKKDSLNCRQRTRAGFKSTTSTCLRHSQSRWLWQSTNLKPWSLFNFKKSDQNQLRCQRQTSTHYKFTGRSQKELCTLSTSIKTLMQNQSKPNNFKHKSPRLRRNKLPNWKS